MTWVSGGVLGIETASKVKPRLKDTILATVPESPEVHQGGDQGDQGDHAAKVASGVTDAFVPDIYD